MTEPQVGFEDSRYVYEWDVANLTCAYCEHLIAEQGESAQEDMCAACYADALAEWEDNNDRIQSLWEDR